jgi:3-deoxy-D-manno-octulosonate 8-phosphate phosphatase (KDO 8-P phosphatase)
MAPDASNAPRSDGRSADTTGGATPSIRLLVLDVDGVLTDGGIALNDHGLETKRFHVHDGCGLRIWQRLGGEVAIVTGRAGLSLRHRLNELGIRHLINGSKDKGSDFARLCQSLAVAPAEVAMLGDDLPDLPILRRCGYPMAVRDGAAEVRAVARFVTTRPGGHGAVREAIEHLLVRAGRWGEAIALYDSPSM